MVHGTTYRRNKKNSCKNLSYENGNVAKFFSNRFKRCRISTNYESKKNP
jgi:hypothetical protein